MNTKEVVIECPKGYEIDQENSTFQKIVFREIEKKLPTEWIDFTGLQGYYIDDTTEIKFWYSRGVSNGTINVWPTKDLAEAALALCQLLRYRDAWNQGWKPDFTDGTTKYSIISYLDKIDSWGAVNCSHVLTFQTKEISEQFRSTFADLLEIAKPLL